MVERKHDRKYSLHRNVLISWEMLESKAFNTLSAAGIKVMLRFLQKRKWGKTRKKIVFDNGGLVFTYAEANLMGIKNTAFFEAVKRVIEVGLIDLEHQGGAYGKDYSRYSISERWREYGTDDFEKLLKPRSLQKGMDVRSNMQRKLKAPTEKRSDQLRKTVAIGEK